MRARADEQPGERSGSEIGLSGEIRWSVVVPTRNRRDALVQTLQRLAEHPDARRLEVVVADNDSRDGTAAAVRGFARRTPGLAVRVLERGDANACAGRNAAVAAAGGDRLLFLDDDSTPRAGTLGAAEAAFSADPRLGAVGGPAFLPGGGQDACALPALSACCGWAVRREAFEAAGGFDESLEMQAEELGLACALLAAGWSVGRRPGVAFDHRRVASGRPAPRRARLDLRNNLCLAARWLPRPRVAAALADLRGRYTALLLAAGGTPADADAAAAEAAALAGAAPPAPLNEAAAEALFGFEAQRAAVARFAAGRGLGRGAPVALGGYTKHAGITHEAAEAAGLEVVAVEDAGPAFRGRSLRGTPVVTTPRGRTRSVALLHTDLNPGRGLPAEDPLGRPVLRLRDAYPADATAAAAPDA